MPTFTLLPVTTKQELRTWAKAIPSVSQMESTAVVDGISEFFDAAEISRGLMFLPIPGEVDLTRLVHLRDEVEWHVTRTPRAGWLSVHSVEAEMEVHAFGYRQPVAGSREVDPLTIDLVLVPGLLFDLQGGRLGRGKGYYDELISRLNPEVRLMGVTVDRRVVAQVPMEPNDRRMHQLATESGCRPVQT